MKMYGHISDESFNKMYGHLVLPEDVRIPKLSEPVIKAVTEKIETKQPVIKDEELNELLKLSGEELWRQGKFDLLKSKNRGWFLLKYKEFFKKDFTGEL